MTLPDQLQHLHATYCLCTGLALTYNSFCHDSDWFLFQKRFDVHDLERVIAYLKKLYADKPNVLAGALRFRHLIRQLDYFGEYLAEANRLAKANTKTDLDRVLVQAGRVPKTTFEKPVKTAEDALKASEFVKQHMAEFRRQQGWA